MTIRQNLIPDLTDGFIDLSEENDPVRPRGGLFCQPTVRTKAGKEKPMDKFVDQGFLIVAKTTAHFQSITDGLVNWWRVLGGNLITFNDALTKVVEGTITLTESNGVLTTFCKE